VQNADFAELFSVETQLMPFDEEGLESFRGSSSYIPEGLIESFESKGGIRPKGRAGTIPGSGTTPSRFSIGVPVTHPIEVTISAPATDLPPTIRHQLTRFEFHLVEMACSFQASPGFIFQDARFEVALEAMSTDQSPLVQAIAYDLFPERIEDEFSIDTKLTISPEIKFTCNNMLETNLALPGYERSINGKSYKGRIEAFGLRESVAGWIFARTAMHSISGSHRLFLLLRKSKNAQVSAVFHLEASVRASGGGGLHRLFMRYRKGSGEIVEIPSYPLC
jgi:hypothetical protein